MCSSVALNTVTLWGNHPHHPPPGLSSPFQTETLSPGNTSSLCPPPRPLASPHPTHHIRLFCLCVSTWEVGGAGSRGWGAPPGVCSVLSCSWGLQRGPLLPSAHADCPVRRPLCRPHLSVPPASSRVGFCESGVCLFGAHLGSQTLQRFCPALQGFSPGTEAWQSSRCGLGFEVVSEVT